MSGGFWWMGSRRRSAGLAGRAFVGLLCCIVGVFVAIPVTFAAITVAYKETVGFEQRTADAL